MNIPQPRRVGRAVLTEQSIHAAERVHGRPAQSHARGHGCDIAATRRLAEVAKALDIALIDHLIFTQEAVYSMRAGGLL